jgi:enamine deaminase RidA (YjgF/YER057c/UK114 family)
MKAETKLKEIGLEFPPAVKPLANYVPAVRTGNLVFLSGQGPRRKDGTMITGKVGAELTLHDG